MKDSLDGQLFLSQYVSQPSPYQSNTPSDTLTQTGINEYSRAKYVVRRSKKQKKWKIIMRIVIKLVYLIRIQGQKFKFGTFSFEEMVKKIVWTPLKVK